jgi:serralysin
VAHIVGTNGNDSLVGTSGVDTIEGLGGNDTLVGLGGSDSLNGGLGNDRYVVGTGDVLSDAGGVDTIETSITWHLAAGFENLVATGTASTSHGGNNLNNHITGNAGANWIAGREGNDTLLGGAGGDTFNMSNGAGASYGSDSIDGGTGVDTLDFGAAARSAVTVDLAAGTASGGGTAGAGTVVFISIENVNGSAFNDSITGNEAANFLFGFDGNDLLSGGDGNDRLEGGAGDDRLRGQFGADTLVGGDGNDDLNADQVGFGTGNAADSLNGGAGNDTLDGGFGSNTLDGGLGDDTYRVWNTGDILSDAGGIDSVITIHTNWTLGAGFENLSTTTDDQGSSAASFLAGNELNNIVDGSEMNVGRIEGRGGNDTLYGSGLDGHTEIDGGDGNDVIHGGHSATMWGGVGNDFLESSFRPDILDGGAGNDTLQGGEGEDQYIFSVSPGLANADSIVGFESATDTVVLDGTAHANLGASGRFAAGDARFAAGAGFTSGQDASDRVVYNTATGQLFYDADGSGAGASQLIATLQGAPTLGATDIVAQGGSSGGSVINGTEGDDTIEGTGSGDTINGFGGNDSLFGNEGGDVLSGGNGNDTLNGFFHTFASSEPDADTLDGGQGNDYFMVDNNADVLIDAGGIDTVDVNDRDWTLGAGFENLVLNTDEGEGGNTGFGNELNNHMRITWAGALQGGGGNDTLVGGRATFASDTLSGQDGDDLLLGTLFDVLDGGAGNDTMSGEQATMTGGAGADHFRLESGISVTDFASAADKLRLDGSLFADVGASGNFAPNDARFHSGDGVTAARDASDRLIYDSATGDLYYDRDGTGSAESFLIGNLSGGPTLVATDIEVVNGNGGSSGGSVINGTSGNDSLVGTSGDDTINALAGEDRLEGLGGNDSLSGATGHDTLLGGDGNDTLVGGGWSDVVTGGPGADSFVYAEAGTPQVDQVTDFVSGTDELLLENAYFTALGANSAWAAGDGRFYAAAGAAAGHDADDRVVYNTTTGALYYDADGSGGGSALIIANFQGAPGIVATDITVI